MDEPGDLKPRWYAGVPVCERRAQRRVRWFDAGLTVFAEVGYAASTVAAISAVAGLSTRQLYEEFDNRAALAGALLHRIGEDAFNAFTEAATRIRPKATTTALFASGVGAWMESVASDPRQVAMMCDPTIVVTAAGKQARMEMTARWSSVVVAVFGPMPSWRVAAIVGAVEATVVEWLRRDPHPPLTEPLDAVSRVVAAARMETT